MVVIGYMLCVVGAIVGFAGAVMFLNVAYRRNLGWFFGCLFLPLVGDVFLLTHWKAAWKPYAISLLGLLLEVLGALMTGYRGA